VSSNLLPSNSSQLEKDLADLYDGYGDLNDALTVLPKVKYGGEATDSIRPYIVWEFNLGAVSEWLTDPEELFSTGLEFQRIQGTKHAVEMALGWIDITPTEIEERVYTYWADFQYELASIPSYDTLVNIVKLSNLAKPTRSRLLRLWHGINCPPLILNQAKLNNSLLQAASGQYREELGVWTSFRDTQGFSLSYDSLVEPEVEFGGRSTIGHSLTYADSLSAVCGFGEYTCTGYSVWYSRGATTPDDIADDVLGSDMLYIVSSSDVSPFYFQGTDGDGLEDTMGGLLELP